MYDEMDGEILHGLHTMVAAPNYIMSNSMLGVIVGGLLQAKF